MAHTRLEAALQVLHPCRLSTSGVRSESASGGSQQEEDQDSSHSAFAYTVHIREHATTQVTLRRLWILWVILCGDPKIFTCDKWGFTEEFLRELAAAQVRYALRP